jgi:hypothetical protein
LASDTPEARRRDADFETHASPRLSASALADQTSNAAPHDHQATKDDREANNDRRTNDDGDASDDRGTSNDRVKHDERSSLTVRGYDRLSNFLIGKSLAETLFLVALVAVFSYTHFNPRLRGTLDTANEREVSGWVVDEADPQRQVEVELYIDAHFVARRRADSMREDVLAVGRAPDARHGFVFTTPPLPARASLYEARVFAVHEGADRDRIGLQIIGKSLWFKVEQNEKNAGTPEKWWEDLERR